MARDLNKVMFIGRLTADPDLRTTTSGQSVANFRLATNRQWNDAQGQQQSQTEFTTIVAWGKLADIVKQYLRKGRQVYVEGRLQTRSFTDRQNQKQWRTEVVAEDVIFLGSPGAPAAETAAQAGAGQVPASPATQPGTPGKPRVPAAATTPAAEKLEEIRIEDIPF